MPEFIQNNLNYLVWPVVLAVGIAYMLIKRANNRKAAASGEDLKRIREEVGKFFPEDSGCQVAYAHYEHTESYGRRTTTTYYRYAVAFQGETMWVFPMGRDKQTKQLQVGRPMTLTADNLGKINVSVSEKEGTVKQVEVHLYDKEGKSIVQFSVDAVNLRKSRFYPVNVLQEDACRAFRDFLTPLAQRVSSENTELEARLAQDAREANGTIAIILSIVGLVAGFFFGPLGLIVSGVGLVVAVRGKMQGAQKNTGLIVSGVITVVLAVWSVVWVQMILS